MGEDLADGHFAAAGKAGDVLADCVVKGELAVFLEQQDGGGGELLGDGADGVAHLGRGGDGGGGWGGETGAAVGVGVDELAGLNHGDRGGGDAGLFENLGGDAVDSILEGGIERFDRLGRRDGGSQQRK